MIKNPGDTARIAAAIRTSSLTQREIARQMGISEVSVSNYVNGWRKPSPGRLVTLAHVLGVDVRSLLTESDPA